jgi:hypothetical protein
MRTDGQINRVTDMMKAIGAIRDYVNPNKKYYLDYSYIHRVYCTDEVEISSKQLVI